MSMTSIGSSATSLEHLRRSAEIELLTPGEPGFDDARLAWNRAHRHDPLAVATPTSVAGVVAVVEAARSIGVSVAIQVTGHGPTRVADGAILLDLSRLAAVAVDPVRRRVTIGGGATWQAVLDATAPHGLMPLLGSSPGVGVAGYLLGGGVGWLQRPFGTAADSVHRFELVTADGSVVEASDDTDPELAWALRGAGAGHLGVVTEVEIELFPVSELYAGNLLYPAEMATEVLCRWRDWVPDLPEALTSSIVLMNYPPIEEVPPPIRGRSFVIVRGAHVGPRAEAERLLSHFRDWQTPLLDHFGPMSLDRVSEISQDPTDPLPGVTAGFWLQDLSDATIDELVATAIPSGGPPQFVFGEVRHCARAFAGPPGSITALTQEGATMLLDLVAVTPTVADQVDARLAVDRLRERISGDLTGRPYLNLLEGDERRFGLADALGPAATERISRLKTRLDPERRFDHGLDVRSAPPIHE